MKAFLTHSANSSPGKHAGAIAAISGDVGEVVNHVRDMLLHGDQLALYDVKNVDLEGISRETLPLEARLDQILVLNEKPLSEKRDLSQRAIGTCRDYALMTCGILREKDIPARVRCGFARYFIPHKYEDHWICEAWQPLDGKWRQIDTQLDEAHQKHLGIEFDTTDLPPGEFLTSVEAWHHYRDEDCDPDSFGHGEAIGAWFLWINLARDFLSLTGQEISDWDSWRNILPNQRQLTITGVEACEELARSISNIENGVNGTGRLTPLQPFWKTGDK